MTLACIAQANGSPSRTLVIDNNDFPFASANQINFFLKNIHSNLYECSHKEITKYAFIKKSCNPLYDLDYYFVQIIPGHPFTFDLCGNCGHSILAAVSAAFQFKWFQDKKTIRVKVYNDNSSVVCELNKHEQNKLEYAIHFVYPQKQDLASFLPTGKPITILPMKEYFIESSIVSAGNPYVFIDARDLGIYKRSELFNAGKDVLCTLEEIRMQAKKYFDFPYDSVFPKIAAILGYSDEIAIRAISVPSWHPTLAVTGTVCLTTALHINGTILNRRAENKNGTANIITPGGRITASCHTENNNLIYNTIYNKEVIVKEVIQVYPLKNSRSFLTREFSHV